MISALIPQQWEVWLVKFEYDDCPGVKKNRPAIVFDSSKLECIALKVTGHLPRDCYDYSIVEWGYAGLDKSSCVRINHSLALDNRDFIFKIGRLHPKDISGLVALIEKVTDGKPDII